jgi:hypothetical protein
MSDAGCHCLQCEKEREDGLEVIPAWYSRMTVCAICGNKRCPHATDHRHACTNSNEPGQAGSVYGPATPLEGKP